MNASNVDRNINCSEPIITLLPVSNVEEGRTSNITENLSNKDSNFIMGEGSLTSTIDTTGVEPLPPSPLPQTSTIVPTTVPTISPTFQGVMNDLITTLFSSQSTKPDIQIHEENDEDQMVGFIELEFNPEE